MNKRRQFLKAAAGTAAATTLSSCSSPDATTPAAADERVFKYGVASGDPLHDRVILWTHISQASAAVGVSWIVATDPELSNIVRHSGDGLDSRQPGATDSSRDYTYKVDVTGLSAETTYYYQFTALGQTSPIGRTRTTPQGDVEQLRFAVCSCSKYHHGYWNAYRHIAERQDLDAVLHLGDYYYEEGGTNSQIPERNVVPNEITYTLDQYRTRHALFKSDIDLQEAHRQHPFIVIWDDHETADNAWKDGAHRHNEDTHGPWADRKAAGVRAYDEWLPVRTIDRSNLEKIYRVHRYGNLVDLIMIDARLIGRTEEMDAFTNAETPGDPCEAKREDRTILGAEQRQWLLEELSNSTAKWRVIGNQVMIAQLLIPGTPDALPDFGIPADTPLPVGCGGGFVLNSDQWDGYANDQYIVFNHLADNGIDNNIVLTGDIHSSWANELTNNLDTYGTALETTVGVEFICPGVTSNPNSTLQQFRDPLQAGNPHIKYLDTDKRGYFLLDITADKVQAEWNYVTTLLERNSAHTVDAIWYTDVDSNKLTEGANTSPEKANPPAFAPSGGTTTNGT